MHHATKSQMLPTEVSMTEVSKKRKRDLESEEQREQDQGGPVKVTPPSSAAAGRRHDDGNNMTANAKDEEEEEKASVVAVPTSSMSIGSILQDLLNRDEDIVKLALNSLTAMKLAELQHRDRSETLILAGGCFVLVQAMRNHPMNPSIQAAAICILSELAFVTKNKVMVGIIEVGGVEAVFDALQTHTDRYWPLQHHAGCLLGFLASSDAGRKRMAGQRDGVKILADLMKDLKKKKESEGK